MVFVSRLRLGVHTPCCERLSPWGCLMRAAWSALLIPFTLLVLPQNGQNPAPAKLRFRVTMANGLLKQPEDGRVLIVLSNQSSPEPRLSLGRSGLKTPPVLG